MGKVIKVKRPVTIKTVVTTGFKKQATDELSKELQLLDSQIMQLELQNKQIIDQSQGFTGALGDDNSKQIQQAIIEISQKLDQLATLKLELQTQKESINHLALNHVIVTGSLENYVELKIGENLYEKFKEAEILIKDGVIQEINM